MTGWSPAGVLTTFVNTSVMLHSDTGRTHSFRNVTIGSTFVARRAGIQQASERHARQQQRDRHEGQRIGRADAVQQSLDQARERITAASKPVARPRPVSNSPCLSISRNTSPRPAPSAMRMPISRVRRLTAYDITPYKPTPASSNAINPNRLVNVEAMRAAAIEFFTSS